jgi:competence protein ComEC
MVDPLRVLAEARGHLFVFAPVAMAAGIGAWLGLETEPGLWLHLGAALAALAGAAGLARGPEPMRVPAAAVLCAAVGVLACALRAERVEAPVLGFRYHGPVEGIVVGVDRSHSDRLRVTLAEVRLEDVAPDRTPARVRVAFHGDAEGARPEPGSRIRLVAHLAPPEGPVEPGGFDFRRMAWFRGLGALGYTRTPPEILAPPGPGEARINRLREAITLHLLDAIGGDAGGVAAALTTGDRSGIGQATTEALRASNLSHLLSISGLHMGLITAFVFGAVRSAIACVPPLALRVPGKKVAAVVALAAGAFYLLISGGNVATERAFVMVSVFLGAVLLDRRAISLRSVAIAAIIILIAQPEALVDPGFQMSFAATAALVAAFAVLRGRVSARRIHWALRPIAVTLFTSAVAGWATAPIAAAHFNRVAEYGLLANVLSVPIVGTFVMPAAVVAAVLAPLGLEAPALWVMEQGIVWVLWVADFVAGLEGAVTAVIEPPGWLLPAIALAGVWVIGWPGRARWIGAAVAALCLLPWAMAQRPAVLVSADGGLVGIMGPQGRVLSAERGAGFTADAWLESDGDLATQAEAAMREGPFAGPRTDRRFALGEWRIAVLKGARAPQALGPACAEADLVIIAARVWPDVPAGCRVIDQRLLARTGALAVTLEADGALRLHATLTDRRRWSGAARRRPDEAPGPWPRSWETAGPAVAVLRRAPLLSGALASAEPAPQ